MYGPGWMMCRMAKKVVRLVVEEARSDATIVHVMDRQAIVVSGVLATQAVAVDGSVS